VCLRNAYRKQGDCFRLHTGVHRCYNISPWRGTSSKTLFLSQSGTVHEPWGRIRPSTEVKGGVDSNELFQTIQVFWGNAVQKHLSMSVPIGLQNLYCKDHHLIAKPRTNYTLVISQSGFVGPRDGGSYWSQR
jgi:hypothetical protein